MPQDVVRRRARGAAPPLDPHLRRARRGRHDRRRRPAVLSTVPAPQVTPRQDDAVPAQRRRLARSGSRTRRERGERSRRRGRRARFVARRPSCGASSSIVTRRLDGMLRGEFLGPSAAGPAPSRRRARTYEAGDDAAPDRLEPDRSFAHTAGAHDRGRPRAADVGRRRPLGEHETSGPAEREKSRGRVRGGGRVRLPHRSPRQPFRHARRGGDEVIRLGPTSTRPELLRVAVAALRHAAGAPTARERDGRSRGDAASRSSAARPRRGQVIVVSDFLDDTDWARRSRRLASRHQVLCVQVVDPRELALPAVGMLDARRHRDRSRLHVQIELGHAARALRGGGAEHATRSIGRRDPRARERAPRAVHRLATG